MMWGYCGFLQEVFGSFIVFVLNKKKAGVVVSIEQNETWCKRFGTMTRIVHDLIIRDETGVLLISGLYSQTRELNATSTVHSWCILVAFLCGLSFSDVGRRTSLSCLSWSLWHEYPFFFFTFSNYIQLIFVREPFLYSYGCLFHSCFLLFFF